MPSGSDSSRLSWHSSTIRIYSPLFKLPFLFHYHKDGIGHTGHHSVLLCTQSEYITPFALLLSSPYHALLSAIDRKLSLCHIHPHGTHTYTHAYTHTYTYLWQTSPLLHHYHSPIDSPGYTTTPH